MTAAHLPGAPQEEREDLLDVLAQELRRALYPHFHSLRAHCTPTVTASPQAQHPDRDPNPQPANLDPIPARAGARLRRAHGA